MSKFSDALDRAKIDPRRILVVSRRLEALRDEDRAIRVARQKLKNDGDNSSDALKEKAAQASRSGRPVTRPTLERALNGRPLPAKAQKRLLRAVNHILAQKKQKEVALGDLF